MKHIYEKDFLPFLKDIIGDLRAVEGFEEMDYIYTTLSYIVEASEIPDKREFIKTVKTGLSDVVNEGKIMTTMAEHWKQEGIEVGMQAGIQTGIQEGYRKGFADAEQLKMDAFAKTIATKLFNQGLNIEQIASITGLSIQEIETIKNKTAN